MEADRSRRREGRYPLRTNLSDNNPALPWQYHTQFVAVQEAFRNLKRNCLGAPAIR
jgi:hypothetical protein